MNTDKAENLLKKGCLTGYPGSNYIFYDNLSFVLNQFLFVFLALRSSGYLEMERSILAKYQVYHPAPASVHLGSAAVVEDVGIVAPRVEKRVGQDRHRTEVP